MDTNNRENKKYQHIPQVDYYLFEYIHLVRSLRDNDRVHDHLSLVAGPKDKWLRCRAPVVPRYLEIVGKPDTEPAELSFGDQRLRVTSVHLSVVDSQNQS